MSKIDYPNITEQITDKMVHERTIKVLLERQEVLLKDFQLLANNCGRVHYPPEAGFIMGIEPLKKRIVAILDELGKIRNLLREGTEDIDV